MSASLHDLRGMVRASRKRVNRLRKAFLAGPRQSACTDGEWHAALDELRRRERAYERACGWRVRRVVAGQVIDHKSTIGSE